MVLSKTVAGNNGKRRINDELSRVNSCVLIGTDGTNHGEVDIDKAFNIAEQAMLDLVEVGGSPSCPTCKVMDWSKYRYEQSKKERTNRKKSVQQDTKQIKLGVKIGDGDLQHKTAKMAKLLSTGHKVVVIVTFRGREMAHPEIGYDLLDKVKELTRESGNATAPKFAGRDITMTIIPHMMKPMKKG